VRSIGVVTVARSDYGIYRPLLRCIQADPDLKLMLFVGGMHLSPEFGMTVREIEQDGFPIAERVEMLLSSDSPEGVSKAMGLGLIGFAQAFARIRPDILIVLGDRFEMFAAAAAALPFKIPIAHLHGGELTQGAMDDSLRHAITKLSHLHFAATATYAQRIIQMGEDPWRVVVSGALSLDSIRMTPLLSLENLQSQCSLEWHGEPLLVTFHPVTLEQEQTEYYINELLAALEASGCPIVFTFPNADAGGRVIIQRINKFVETHLQAQVVANFGVQGYLSMMQYSEAMVGNSSSGIVEAASFHLPVVNIGTRQEGRIHPANVIDVGYEREAILNGIQRATAPEFRAMVYNASNPFGDSHAAERIVRTLKQTPVDASLLVKVFHEAEAPTHLLSE